MAYPDDLSNVAVFKVHPAIGVARIANNDDYYEFFDYEAKRAAGRAGELQYMSLRDGKHWMKRQAVQFKVFAYDAGGAELGEFTEALTESLGFQTTWRASVANRKLNNWSGGATPVVAASASASGGAMSDLEGDNPWRAGKVWLGTLTGRGLFLPSKGGVYRKTVDTEIPPYGAHQQDNGVLDTTCDGSITVDLGDVGGIPIVPACVLVAPQDHSPDVSAAEVENATNTDWVRSTRELLGIDPDSRPEGEGFAMDIAMMNTMNGDYNPGMEICLDATAALPDPAAAFYPRGGELIGENEIRPSYEAGYAQHGALTAGLCSAWQTDLTACLNWWTAEYPNTVQFEQDPTERFLARERFAEGGLQMDHPEVLNAYVDMMGVGRNEQDDPFFLFERERGEGDDVGPQPQAPFPLDAPR
jgi:hypothetical protein